MRTARSNDLTVDRWQRDEKRHVRFIFSVRNYQVQIRGSGGSSGVHVLYARRNNLLRHHATDYDDNNNYNSNNNNGNDGTTIAQP